MAFNLSPSTLGPMMNVSAETFIPQTGPPFSGQSQGFHSNSHIQSFHPSHGMSSPQGHLPQQQPPISISSSVGYLYNQSHHHNGPSMPPKTHMGPSHSMGPSGPQDMLSMNLEQMRLQTSSVGQYTPQQSQDYMYRRNQGDYYGADDYSHKSKMMNGSNGAMGYYNGSGGGGGDYDMSMNQQHGPSIPPNSLAIPGIDTSVQWVKELNADDFLPGFFPQNHTTQSYSMRHEVLRRQRALYQNLFPAGQLPENVPTCVENRYQGLCPLEPSTGHHSSTLHQITSTYKAIDKQDKNIYCLYRIHNFLPTGGGQGGLSEAAHQWKNLWKKIRHPNIVSFRAMFLTKAFGDISLVFVLDYFPLAETLPRYVKTDISLIERQQFSHRSVNLYSRNVNSHNKKYDNTFILILVPYDENCHPPILRHLAWLHKNVTSRSLAGGQSTGSSQRNLTPVKENQLWSFLIQLSSALNAVHSNGLACRCLYMSKVLVYSKSRVRLNCLGFLDTLQGRPYSMMPNKNMYNMHGGGSGMPNGVGGVRHSDTERREDLRMLGLLIAGLAYGTDLAILAQNNSTSPQAVDSIREEAFNNLDKNYSEQLSNLIRSLVYGPPEMKIDSICAQVGTKFLTQFDSVLRQYDYCEEELAKEVHNGRLLRLTTKLAIINDRSHLVKDNTWSETGDRYSLKLFRDYLYHQVTANDHPWIDMGHIVQCLNKLDSGVNESVYLVSPDERVVLILTYQDLKQCLRRAWNDLLQAANVHNSASGLGHMVGGG